MTTTVLPSIAPRSLLVIEPNPRWRELIVAVGSWHFSEVASVRDFQAAQRTLARRVCCVAIAEYELTDGSGLALYDHVRRQDHGLIFILMSEELRVAISDSLFRYLHKPFDQEELSTLFRSLTRCP